MVDVEQAVHPPVTPEVAQAVRSVEPRPWAQEVGALEAYLRTL